MERFGFLFHPLAAADVAKKFTFTERWPERLTEFVLRLTPPFKASHVTGLESAHAQAEGWFVALTMTSRQMLAYPEPYVISQIVRSCRLAERLGARIVGLGAFTSVVGDAGITVAKNVGIAVTTGNTYTVATSLEGTRLAARLMGHDLKRSAVAVVGATGAIGSACARILARETNDLTLVARNGDNLQTLARRIVSETGLACRISTDVRAAVGRADVIVAVSGAATPVIEPTDPKPGAVVCDVARPRDVSARIARERDDVLVIDGGVVEVPGDNVQLNFRLGLPPRQVLACMAETMMLAMEGRYENFTLGRDISVAKIDEINRIADRHGFKLAGLRSFERALTEEQIAGVGSAAALRAGA